jgi:hypothetical protein
VQLRCGLSSGGGSLLLAGHSQQSWLPASE